MNTITKALVLTCLFVLPSAAQDTEGSADKNAVESKAEQTDKAQQAEQIKKAEQAEQAKQMKKAKQAEKVYAFLDEHFPEMRAELDTIRKNEGEAAYEAVYSEQVNIYKHYQRSFRSGGKDMAMLVIEQNKMHQELQVLLDRYESLAPDDPARVEARANAEPLLAKSNTFGGEWAKQQVIMLKKKGADKYAKQIAGLEKKAAKMDALRTDPKKVFDEYVAYRESVIKAASESKKKLPANWHTDPAEALAAASKSGKLVHAFCSATWCAPCQVMVKKVFPKDEVKKALEEFEPLYLDGDVYGPFCRKYHVRVFPTSIIIDAEGNFLHRSGNNGMSAEQFLEWLKVKK